MPETSQLEIAYRLTGACYYQPDPLWQEADLFSNLQQALQAWAPALANHAAALRTAADQTGQTPLLVDYAALFVGPGTLLAAPYGSVYLEKDRQVMGASTQAALECYQSAGLALADDFPELPDHIAVELEFCCYLLQQQLTAEQTGDTAAANKWRTERRTFLQQHLGRWATPFCASQRQQAETAFYRRLADLLEGLVLADLQQMETSG